MDIADNAAKAGSVTARGSSAAAPKWTGLDTTWVLGLYGTAIGAGTLFLPINAGVGGLWPLVVMVILALPMTFFAHRALCRFVLSGSAPDGDITEVVEEHFGQVAGRCITVLYFLAIYPILLVYSVAATNTVLSFIKHQLHFAEPPRAFVALVLILVLMSLVRLGEQRVVKVMSLLVYPFAAVLVALALALIPHWSATLFTNAAPLGSELSSGGFYKTMWLAIPVIVFSFNHSPIISRFAVNQRLRFGANADKPASRILLCSHVMMVCTVMLFAISCILSLSPADLELAREQNVSILSYLANHFNSPLIEWAAPLIAIVAISKSFLGHYLGAREGFEGLVNKSLRGCGKSIRPAVLNRVTVVFMILTTWAVATANPSILSMLETLGGPVLAVLLFLMPMYAIACVPALRVYRGKISNVFVVVMGVIALTAIVFSLIIS